MLSLEASCLLHGRRRILAQDDATLQGPGDPAQQPPRAKSHYTVRETHHFLFVVLCLKEMHDECDDSPVVTSDRLTAAESPYRRLINIVHTRDLMNEDVTMMHAAIRDVILSNDPNAGEALEYLTEWGMSRASPNEESFVVLAARQHESPAYISMLVALAMVHCDFDDKDDKGESARHMIEKRAPGLVTRIMAEANAVNAGSRC